MSEQRLIDANNLRNNVNLTDEEIDRYAKENVLVAKEWQRLADRIKAARDGFIMDINETPTIDPEELPIVQELRAKLARYKQADAMKHGHWVLDRHWFECSICNQLALNSDTDMHLQVLTDYCPHCGARMDKEDTSNAN